MKEMKRLEKMGDRYNFWVKVNLSILITFFLFCSSCDSDKLSDIKRTNYGNGLFREGYYNNDVPIGTHFYYQNNVVLKKIQYVNWSKEFLQYYGLYKEEFNLGEIDTTKLEGFPNAEIYIANKDKLDSTKSNFITLSRENDSTLKFFANISKFKNYLDESAHIFIFKEDEVRYIVQDKFNFELECSVSELDKILSGIIQYTHLLLLGTKTVWFSINMEFPYFQKSSRK